MTGRALPVTSACYTPRRFWLADHVLIDRTHEQDIAYNSGDTNARDILYTRTIRNVKINSINVCPNTLSHLKCI